MPASLESSAKPEVWRANCNSVTGAASGNELCTDLVFGRYLATGSEKCTMPDCVKLQQHDCREGAASDAGKRFCELAGDC